LVFRTAASVLTIVLTLSHVEPVSPMDPNTQHLAQAQAHARLFHQTVDTEELRRAALALEGVTLSAPPPAAEAAMRRDGLRAWLLLLELIDRHLDPAFDVSRTPDLQVQPPESADGSSHPPGADPALIADPRARAAYEQATRENDARIASYNLQVRLHRLDERITARTDAFIRRNYTFDPADRQEIRSEVGKLIRLQSRQERILKACC
jgi:hypothetical protein